MFVCLFVFSCGPSFAEKRLQNGDTERRRNSPDNSFPPEKGLTPRYTPARRAGPGRAGPGRAVPGRAVRCGAVPAGRGAAGAVRGAEWRGAAAAAPGLRPPENGTQDSEALTFNYVSPTFRALKLNRHRTGEGWGIIYCLVISLFLQLLLLGIKLSLARLGVLLLLFKKQRLGALPRAPFHPLCLLQYAELAGFKLLGKVSLGAKTAMQPPD